MARHKSFSAEFPPNANKLLLEIEASKFDPDGGQNTFHNYPAIIDTGATTSCVSSKVAKDLDLSPIGLLRVSGINNSTKDCPLYKIILRLPNGITLDQVVVGTEAAGSDILIGLDLLRKGDFAISHVKTGELLASFVYPPLGKEIDFGEITGKIEREARKNKRK